MGWKNRSLRPILSESTFKTTKSKSRSVNGERIGNDARFTAAGVPATKGTHMNFAVDANLKKHDEIAIHLYTTIDEPIPVRAEYWLEIRRLGPKVVEFTEFDEAADSDSSTTEGTG